MYREDGTVRLSGGEKKNKYDYGGGGRDEE